MSRFLETLDLSPDSVFHAQSLVVVDAQDGVDGSFVLHSLAAEFERLSGDGKMLLLLNHQTTGHWTSIAGKLRWNLTQAKDQGRIAVIDVQKTTYEFLIHPERNIHDSDFINPETHSLELDHLYAKCLQQVNKLYPSELHSSKEKSKLLIILEDLTNIFHTTKKSNNTITVLEFLRKLRFTRPDLDICIATLVNSTKGGSNASNFSSIVANVLPNLVFSVSPLKTGFSSKYNGMLSVRQEERVFHIENPSLATQKFREYHYKLEERGVKLFPL